MNRIFDKILLFITENLLARKKMFLNFVRFYTVGLILFMIPFTREFFIFLIPFSLLLVIGVVLYFHENWKQKTVIYFDFIVVATFFLKMAGTITGDIFGTYSYYWGLGRKVNHAPVMFGGDKEEGLIFFEKAITQMEATQGATVNNWFYSNLLTLLARYYEERKEYVKAGETYRKILRVEPNFTWVKNELYPEFQKKHPNT